MNGSLMLMNNTSKQGATSSKMCQNICMKYTYLMSSTLELFQIISVYSYDHVEASIYEGTSQHVLLQRMNLKELVQFSTVRH